jgi:hypothetical protein
MVRCVGIAAALLLTALVSGCALLPQSGAEWTVAAVVFIVVVVGAVAFVVRNMGGK